IATIIMLVKMMGPAWSSFQESSRLTNRVIPPKMEQMSSSMILNRQSRAAMPSASGLFIGQDRVIDFVGMCFIIAPRGIQIGLLQRRAVARTDLLIGHAQTTRLHEHPNCDASVPDTGLAAQNVPGLADQIRRGKYLIFLHGTLPSHSIMVE